jgi:hypothetical protein
VIKFKKPKMKKRIITSFQIFESSLKDELAKAMGGAYPFFGGSSDIEDMSKTELEVALEKAKKEDDEGMIEEIEELISQIKKTELDPETYTILNPPRKGGGGGGGGGRQEPKPKNVKTWPPPGTNPGGPPPPLPGKEEKGQEKKQPPSSIIGKRAKITSGPHAGQIGIITGITPDGQITIQPE